MNFALILFCLTVFTGLFWFAEVLYFKKKRQAAFVAAIDALDERMAKNPEAFAGDERQKQVERLSAQTRTVPAWLEFPASFFPVIAVVFCLRSFIVEPFKIDRKSVV